MIWMRHVHLKGPSPGESLCWKRCEVELLALRKGFQLSAVCVSSQCISANKWTNTGSLMAWRRSMRAPEPEGRGWLTATAALEIYSLLSSSSDKQIFGLQLGWFVPPGNWSSVSSSDPPVWPRGRTISLILPLYGEHRHPAESWW